MYAHIYVCIYIYILYTYINEHLNLGHRRLWCGTIAPPWGDWALGMAFVLKVYMIKLSERSQRILGGSPGRSGGVPCDHGASPGDPQGVSVRPGGPHGVPGGARSPRAVPRFSWITGLLFVAQLRFLLCLKTSKNKQVCQNKRQICQNIQILYSGSP